MHTRLLMTCSAAIMAAAGLAATFLPQEILSRYSAAPSADAVLLLQLLGALYLGFAMLNWMARRNLLGGIYSRPIALGNFVHFAVVAIALSKAVARGADAPRLVAAAAYLAFAAWFGLVVFTHPDKTAG